MLIQLKIENIALIEIIEINFEKGLNIITGDSGSGKSLILDSLNVLFGGTNIPLKHLIRPGKDYCAIEAKFSYSFQIKNWLIINGFKSSSSVLNIKRISYRKNNKVLSKYSLNNLSINKKLLEELGRLLIDFAGQSDTFIFDSQDKRRLIIDDLCSQELRDTSAKIKNIWEESQVLKGLMYQKIESSKKQEENNLMTKQILKTLEEANLESSKEISKLQLLETKLINNLEINNSINFGLLNITFIGNAELKGIRPLLAFYFEELKISISSIPIFNKELKKPEDKRMPFFSLVGISTKDNWLCARGRGGGLAIWVKP